MHNIIWFLLVLFYLRFDISSGNSNEHSLKYTKRLPTGFVSWKQGEYYIQGLVSISDKQPCTQITARGLLRTYAIKFAVDRRTKFKNWNTTLGYRINDACTYLPVAMSHGIEIVNKQQQTSCAFNNKNTNKCQNLNFTQNKLLAVSGAYFSFLGVPLASLFGVKSIPFTSFGSSTPLLSKRADYPSFFRTIPSDEYAVKALLDVIAHFNWTYVFAIGSDDDYGKFGLSLLKKGAKKIGVCITGEIYVPFRPSGMTQIASTIASKIRTEDKAIGVVMFNYAKGLGDYIIKAADDLNLRRIWLTSEAWNPAILSSTVIPKRQLSSIITVSIDRGKPLPEFVDYIDEIVYDRNNSDIWLNQYVKGRFNCSISDSRSNPFPVLDSLTRCSVSEKEITDSILEENASQVNNLIDAMDSIVEAIDIVAKSKCTIGKPCNEISPESVKNALQNVSFKTRFGKQFSYNQDGNPSIVTYSIEQIQYRHEANESWKYVPVGRWSNEDSIKLRINNNDIIPQKWSSDHYIPFSRCSIDCQPGEKRVGLQGCCWTCEACSANTITNSTNQNKCISCQVGYHTVDNTKCEKTPIVYLGIGHPIGIVTVSLSVVGMILNIICTVLVFVYRDTESIKKSSPKFFFFSFVLLLLTFAYTFFHIVNPTDVSCRAQGVFYHTLLILYSAAVLLNHKNKSLSRFVSKLIRHKNNEIIGQIIIFVCLVAIEIGFIVGWQIKGEDFMEKSFDDFKYLKKCKFSFTTFHVLSYVYPLLIFVVTLIQTKSDRELFSQDKDLKYLHYTCLAFCIISVADVITVNHVAGVYAAMVTLCTSIAYGYVYMGCMVISKVLHTINMAKTNNKKSVKGNENVAFQRNVLSVPGIAGQPQKSTVIMRFNSPKVENVNKMNELETISSDQSEN